MTTPIGEIHGSRTVMGISSPRRGKTHVLCECKCGSIDVVSLGALRFGNRQQCVKCGSRQRSISKTGKKRPDLTIYHYEGLESIRRRLRSTVLQAIRRCHVPKNPDYPNYGGRGIAVCEEWRNDKSAFFNYLKCLPDHDNPECSLDRVNNSGGYEPGNLRFATAAEQRVNQRKKLKWATAVCPHCGKKYSDPKE